MSAAALDLQAQNFNILRIMQRALTLQQPHSVEPTQAAAAPHRRALRADRTVGLHLFAALLLRPLRLSVQATVSAVADYRLSMGLPHPRSSVLANRRFVLSERSTDTEGEAPWLEGIVSVRCGRLQHGVCCTARPSRARFRRRAPWRALCCAALRCVDALRQHSAAQHSFPWIDLMGVACSACSKGFNAGWHLVYSAYSIGSMQQCRRMHRYPSRSWLLRPAASSCAHRAQRCRP